MKDVCDKVVGDKVCVKDAKAEYMICNHVIGLRYATANSTIFNVTNYARTRYSNLLYCER